MTSISKVHTQSDGVRYRARYRDHKGRSRERRFRRKTDAEQFLTQVSFELNNGEYLDPKAGCIPYGEWATHWIGALPGKKPSTLASYRDVLDNLVLPYFGSTPINAIGPGAIKEWMRNLEDGGTGTSRRRQAFWVVSGSLRAAVDDRLIRRNPADQARQALPAPAICREPIFLTIPQVERLADAVGPLWQGLVNTLAYAGLRWSEACALRRRACDLETGSLHIIDSTTEVNGMLHRGPTKSGRDRRVAIPRFLVEKLSEHLDSVADDPDALVFTTPEGGQLRRSNFRRRVWAPAIEAAGLPEGTTIHDLRHTAASLMIHHGAHIELVRVQLGHASIETTQRYAHLYPTATHAVTAILDAAIETELA